MVEKNGRLFLIDPRGVINWVKKPQTRQRRSSDVLQNNFKYKLSVRFYVFE